LEAAELIEAYSAKHVKSISPVMYRELAKKMRISAGENDG
jgi:hypothetical protein